MKNDNSTPWFLIAVLIYLGLVSNHSPLSLKLYLVYGSPTPCGALLNAITRQAFEEVETYKNNKLEYAGAIVGTALGRAAAEQKISSLNFLECGSALSKL